MKASCTNAIIALFAIVSGSCSQIDAPVYTLGTPRFVPQSQPDAVIETGISQYSNGAGEEVFLQWYGVHGAAGYRIFRSDTTTVGADGKRKPVAFEEITGFFSMLNDTSGFDNHSIQIDTTYFYYINAYIMDESTSKSSDTASITLVARPSLICPGIEARINSDSLSFTWIDGTQGGHTIIRVKGDSNYVWVRLGYSDFRFNDECKIQF